MNVDTRKSSLQITPLTGALGATVRGLHAQDVETLAQSVVQELLDAWHEHLVLFFPQIGLTPAQQVALAGRFGPRLAATTELGSDYRGAPTLADEGFPQILVLDTEKGQIVSATNVWHTDVTFVDTPPIGSLFCMERPADTGGDTMWSNQYLALEGLSAPIRDMIRPLQAVHGRPPLTGTATHPMVCTHAASGREYLNVNRGWTSRVTNMSATESTHLLALLNERAERPEYQIRWQWTAGDAALWDNRCTMHYAVDDYERSPRRARRCTIYGE